MKRIIAVILSIVFFANVAACDFGGKKNPTPQPAGTPEVTVVPTSESKTNADIQFEALDREVFVDIVTGDGLSYHQFVIDPASFGIEENEVERGWGDFSYSAQLEGIEENAKLLERLRSIDADDLSESNRIAYEMLFSTLEKSSESAESFYYNEPLLTLNGEHSMLPMMMTFYEIYCKNDIENYLYLLEDAPRYLGQIEQFEREKAEKGLFMTENSLDQVLESCRKYVEEGETFFLIGYFEDIMENLSFDVSDEKKAEYIERNKAAVINGLLPAYERLIVTLEGLRSSCGAFVGACDRGDEAKLQFIKDVQSKGAWSADIETIANALEKLCNDEYLDMFGAIYTNPGVINEYDKEITSGNPEDDVNYLKDVIKDIYPEIPEQKITYVDVPESVAEDFSPAAYLISAFDDSSRNVVMFNPTADSSTLLFTIAHECFPGHLYQTQYFRAMDGLSLTQQAIAPTGYTEGWAVFSETQNASLFTKYGAALCKVKQTESVLCNILIPAYLSLMINVSGWEKADMKNYLEKFNLNVDGYVDIIYEYAIDMPTYFFNYALGYTCTKAVYDSVSPKDNEEKLDFFTRYLNYGPCSFDILFEKFGVEF